MATHTKKLVEKTKLRDSFQFPVSSKNFISEAWQRIYLIFKNQLDDPKGRNQKWIWSTSPKKPLKEKSDYPIVLIPSPEWTGSRLTLGFRKKLGTYTMDIMVFAENPAYLDQLTQKIICQLNREEDNLRESGLVLSGEGKTTSRTLTRGGLYIRIKTIPIEMRFAYDI